MNQNIDQLKFKQLLKQAGFSSTKPRSELFRILNDYGQPIDIKVINNQLSADRASIYRNLELFTKLKLVNRVSIGWKTYYELSETFKPHHHHLICKNCSSVVGIDDLEIEAAINLITAKRRFSPTDHIFEVRGLCQNCQS